MQMSKNNDVKYEPYVDRLTPAQKTSAWLCRIGLWILMIIVLFPILLVLTTSVIKGNSFTTSVFPKTFTLVNYKKVFTEMGFTTWVWNSLKVCTTIAVVQLLLTIPAGFAFSKIRFKGRSKGLMFLLILQMFPTSMALPAMLSIVYKFNGIDSLLWLVLIQCGGSAYNVWLMKGNMDGIPDDLVEAAYVDGATTFQTFIQIILPLIKNMLLVIFLFAFINAYSEIIYTTAIIKDQAKWTMSIGLYSFVNKSQGICWTEYSAAAILASLPIVIIFMALQKFIATGLTAGSVKG